MYDNIADMDAQVGEILKQLEDDGLADNTIVFYWSDHGDGVPRAKRSLYDSGLRVPLMIRWPKTLGAGGGARLGPRRARQLHRSGADGARAGRRRRSRRISRGACSSARRPRRAPEFVFAARDRMDIEYDMMRSARDTRFLYIRNFAPELPYAGHIIYRNQSAIMQEWFRLQAERKLTGPAALWMRTQRPAEELYDTAADPHQIRDLSAEPAHRATLDAHAQRGDRVDGAHRRSGPGERARDDSADVAGRRAAGNGAALHRAAPDDRRSGAAGVHDDRGADGGRHLRADSGRLDRLHHRGRDRRRSGGSTPGRSSSTGR